MPASRPSWPSTSQSVGLAVAGLAALAVINEALARRAERKHAPEGRFMEVDGVRLHYTDHGAGRPIVLVHGNAVSGHDFLTSGVAGALARTNRVIIFDRPGFGHSKRPRRRIWTAAQQASLLQQALSRLEIEHPVIMGHSWGALVALAMGLNDPAGTAGLVLISGYYFPSLRLDAPLVAPVALPVLRDLLRYTVSPVLGRLLMPAFKRALFAPARVPPRFQAEYSAAMALRPSQIRATSEDGALLMPSANRLFARYGELTMPVAIMAGHGDKIVSNRQAERLHAAISGSALHLVHGVGHMLHHIAIRGVLAAVTDVLQQSGVEAPADQTAGVRPVRRHA